MPHLDRYLKNELDLGEPTESLSDDWIESQVDMEIRHEKTLIEAKVRERLRLVYVVPDSHGPERDGMKKTLEWILRDVLQVSII